MQGESGHELSLIPSTKRFQVRLVGTTGPRINRSDKALQRRTKFTSFQLGKVRQKLACPRYNILAILSRPKAARPKEPRQDNFAAALRSASRASSRLRVASSRSCCFFAPALLCLLASDLIAAHFDFSHGLNRCGPNTKILLNRLKQCSTGICEHLHVISRPGHTDVEHYR